MTDRKSQIIEVATELIKKNGYDSFSYKDLSEAVGITKATLHHHFPKKEDLGIAVLDTIRGQQTYLKEKTLEIEGAKERLTFMFQSMRSIIGQREICPISSMQAEYNVIPDTLKEKLLEVSQIEIDLLTQVLKEGRQQGTLNFDGEDKDMALTMMTAYKGALMYGRVMTPEVIDTVLDGLLSSLTR